MRAAVADERVEPHEDDVVVAEDGSQRLEVEEPRIPRPTDLVAPKGRRVEDDRPALGDPVSASDRGRLRGAPALVEQDVGARDPELGAEPIQRQAEGLGVGRCDAVARDEAQVVVGMDAHVAKDGRARPEGLAGQAVPEPLQRPAGVPDLDDPRPPARADRVDREVVVVHHEQAGRGEVIAGDDAPPAPRSTRPRAPAVDRWARVVTLTSGACSGDPVTDRGEVAAEHVGVAGGQDDPPPDGAQRAEREADADEPDPDEDDEIRHGPAISWSMIRSVAEPPLGGR